jgi:hypothetical protein
MNIPSSDANDINKKTKFLFFIAAPTIGQKFIGSGFSRATKDGAIRGLSLITTIKPTAANNAKMFYCNKRLFVASIISVF